MEPPPPHSRAASRVLHLSRQIVSANADVTTASAASAASVTPEDPSRVPLGYDDAVMRSRWAYDTIRWMVQKDALDQE